MSKTTKEKYICFYCGKELAAANYYNSNSGFYSRIGKIPFCKHCIEKFYKQYFKKYTDDGCQFAEKKAIKRLCMFFDIYYREDICDSALKKIEDGEINISPIGQYMKTIQLFQYNKNKETYENTIIKEEEDNIALISADDTKDFKVDEATKNFFGNGFKNDDYRFLKKEYEDWVARHECKTKAQEEVFKRLCFKQLEILKATQKGEDTKDLDATFQKLLDTAKLQPKQNSGDTTADNQTFGTLIDKWENTRPLPEIDEELKDVDKIALYIDIFFKGHLSKMMGLKNAFSNLYTKFMKKYTVEKPEYSDEENSEILFDAIFGNQSSNSDNE